MMTFRAVRGYMARYRVWLAAGFAIIIAANLVALIPPLIIAQVIDGLKRHQLTPGDLPKYAALLVLVGLGVGVLQFFSRFVVNSVSRYVEYDLRSALFRQFQRLDLAYFQDAKLGDLVARATNDLSQVRMMLGPGLTNSCNTIVAFSVTAIVMTSIDARLTLYSLTVMPLITILFVVLRRGIELRFRRVQDQFGLVSAQAQENFSGIRVVKAYVQEEHELAAFNAGNAEYVSKAISFARLNALLWPSMYAISGLAVALLLWRGGIDVIEGRIPLGQFVRFNAYLAALSFPMIALGWTFNLFQQGSASLARVREVMDTVPTIRDSDVTAPDLAPTSSAVEFRQVSLSYGDHEVLHDVSFAVPPGGSLGIIGHTGAGKSSIVNLISRVYEFQSGEILIGGVDLRRIPLATLRAMVGYVPQETFLFSISVAENVGFGVEELTPERLDDALDVSQLRHDVADFPDGAYTMVGERGVTLSGGQKQRASIARAVARDPRILILDDALSSVDTHTEAEILRRLRVLMEGRTAIVIAHRISTVKTMDQIVVIEDGRIVERGTHASLVAEGGIYADMYRRQLLSDELAVEEPEGPLDAVRSEPASGRGGPSVGTEE
ncbi:MAG TPA: ABC transporter ATP-binding protein [Ktedonobacterales bacterium]|nr:ABC transporter ATP-binding protein [Ktedonobacterales bacterium]